MRQTLPSGVLQTPLSPQSSPMLQGVAVSRQQVCALMQISPVPHVPLVEQGL